jgi:SAM-dependent methyltransferase
MLDAAVLDRILLHYPHATAFQRWHMRGRLRLCPYDAIPAHLTGSGSLLDVGCGFGHLAWFLEQAKPALKYFGTDIDARKIALAEGSNGSNGADGAKADERADRTSRPEFHLGDAREAPGLPERFGNIVFLDVLYLMPWDLQQRMLEWAFSRLAPGPESVVVMKTMEEARGFSGFRAVAEEWIMVRLLRRTLSSGALNGARPASDYLDFARGLGYRGEAVSLGTFNPSTLIRFHR